MIMLIFFFAFVFLCLSTVVRGAPLAFYFDTASAVAVGVSVWLFLVASGRRGPFFEGLRQSFSFQEKKNAAISETFLKLCLFTPIIGVFWTFLGIIIILGNLNPVTVGSGLAVSFLTSFYAAFLTLFLFWPIAVRLKPFETIQQKIK